MHQRLCIIAGLFALSFLMSTPLQAFDLFGLSARKSSACAACCQTACCCTDIFKCRPEARYCKPECVCCRDKSCVKPLYCKPEKVCAPCQSCVRPWYCKPEPVCADPEPCCQSDCVGCQACK